MGSAPEAVEASMRDDLPRVLAAVRWAAVSNEEAEDAVVEAYAKLWESTSKGGTDIASVPAWVTRVALNSLHSNGRRAAVGRRLRHLVSPWTEESDLSQVVVDSLVVHRAVARLPRQQREAVSLFYFLDLSVADVAKELSCSDGTVKKALSRARVSLAEELEGRETWIRSIA